MSIYTTGSPTKADRARNLRYKRPALMSLGYEAVMSELCNIMEACSDVRWFVDTDVDTLINALDGDEDDAYEFKMAFADLESKAEQLSCVLSDWNIRDEFDDCTVALIGNRYKTVGYDAVEEDYYALMSYERELAHTESGKRLMRHTKAEMISLIGQCLDITIAFLDLRQSYDYLQATLDILRDQNTSMLQTIRDIEVAYEAACEATADGCFRLLNDAGQKFERLLSSLPDRTWLE